MRLPTLACACLPAAVQDRMTEQQRRAAEVAKLRTEREAQLEEQVGSGWVWGSGRLVTLQMDKRCSTTCTS